MKARGRPILGAISGFFLGLFIGVDLFLFGLVDSESVLISALPVIGLVVGSVMGAWAPVGRGSAEPDVRTGEAGADEPA